jgi:hypothetical protein
VPWSDHCCVFSDRTYYFSYSWYDLDPRSPQTYVYHEVSNKKSTACVTAPALKLRYAMLVLSTCSVFGVLPPLCAWVSDNVRTTTGGSIASGLNIAFTGPGQIIGVWIYQQQQSPRYQLGHSVNAASQGLAALLALGLWLYYRRLNAKLAPGEQKWVV